MAAPYRGLGLAADCAGEENERVSKGSEFLGPEQDDVEAGERGKLRMVELHEVKNEEWSKPRKAFFAILLFAALAAMFAAFHPEMISQGGKPAQPEAKELTVPKSPENATKISSTKSSESETEQPEPFWDAYDDYSDSDKWHRVRKGEDTWYEQKNRCYFNNVIHRVNNRLGDPSVCYSACVGVNQRLSENAASENMQCIGWTLIKKPPCGLDDTGYYENDCGENTYRGFNVCLLHNSIAGADVSTDKSCETGKLLNKDLRFPTDVEQATAHAAKANEDRKQVDPARLSPKQKAALEASIKVGITAEEANEYEENEVDVKEDEDTVDKEADSLIDGESAEDQELLAKEEAQNVDLENFTETCSVRASLMAASSDSPNPLSQRPMRVFIGCLQASGCTLLSYLVSQRLRTVSILDLGVRQRVPEQGEFYEIANAAFPAVDTIVLKHSMRGIHSVDPEKWIQHVQEEFEPDRSILFVKDPVESFLHLASHIDKNLVDWPSNADINSCENRGFLNSYGLMCGTPEEKLAALDRLYSLRDKHGLKVFRYETLCEDRDTLQRDLDSLGICIKREALESPELSIVNVMQRSFQFFESGFKGRGGVFWGAGALRNTFTDEWGFPADEPYSLCKRADKARLLKKAGARYNKLTLDQVVLSVKAAAPNLYSLYYGE